MPWYRVWTDILDSEKFAELDDSTIGGWTLILSAVKRFNRGGMLPPQKKLAHWTRRGKATVSAWINDLLEAGLLEEMDGGIGVHDWSHWQEPRDRTNAARQAKHRERKRNALPCTPPRPETETETEGEQIQSDNRYVTELPPLRNGEVTPLQTRPPAPTDEVLTGREGEEHQLFLRVMQTLEDHEPTRHLGKQLLMAADTPEIRGYESWRLWVAACVVLRPNRSKEWGTFTIAAYKATEDEYRRLTSKPVASSFGKHKADPPTNQPASAMNPPADIDEWNRKAAANPENQKTLEIIRSKRNGPKLPPL